MLICNKEAFEIVKRFNNMSEEEKTERLKQYELLNKQNDMKICIDSNIKTNQKSNKFDGGLMGLTYIIYYCKECDTDFAVKSSRDVKCCPSCKSGNIISGDVQDFC